MWYIAVTCEVHKYFCTMQHDFTDDHTVLQLLECEFHSADYHTILDVVTGLKTSIALLEKVFLHSKSSYISICIVSCQLVTHVLARAIGDNYIFVEMPPTLVVHGT